VNINDTLDIDWNDAAGDTTVVALGDSEELIDELRCRDFLDESSRGDKNTVDVQGVVQVQVHVEVNVKMIVTERHRS
jgi:hypothetical protein